MKKEKLIQRVQIEIDEFFEEQLKENKEITDRELDGLLSYASSQVGKEEAEKIIKPYLIKKKEQYEKDLISPPPPEEEEETNNVEGVQEFLEAPPEDLVLVPPEEKEEITEAQDFEQTSSIIKKSVALKTHLEKRQEELTKEINYNYFTKELKISLILSTFFEEIQKLFDIMEKIEKQDFSDLESLSEDFEQITASLEDQRKNIETEKTSEAYLLYPYINLKLQPFLSTFDIFLKNMTILLDAIKGESGYEA